MRRRDAGYSLVTLMAAVAVMLILMTAAIPSWRYLMKNDREEELLFRGGEIADAIARYQRKNGNSLPPSLEALVKGKFLRRAYKDPMTKHGNWRLIRPGEAIGPSGAGAATGGAGGTAGPGGAGGVPGAGLGGSTGAGPGTGSGSSGFGASTSGFGASTSGFGRPGVGGTSGSAGASSAGGSTLSQPGMTLGGFQGVASTSTDKSLRVFNGRTRYNEWLFLPGQPRVVGRPVGPAMPQPGGGVRPPGASASPGPGRSTFTRP